jgi:hypothetical protein
VVGRVNVKRRQQPVDQRDQRRWMLEAFHDPQIVLDFHKQGACGSRGAALSDREHR